ncbi:MAG: PfkB family carbohydrate kinase [Patescibacteria group bacterium]
MENLVDAIDRFKNQRVAIIGDVFLDQSIRGEVERLNPEKLGVPLVRVTDIEFWLGGAGNVARNLASLGASCYLLGQIGNDKYGEKIRELCREEGTKTIFADSGRETIVKQRIFTDGHYVARVDFGEKMLVPIDHEAEEYLEKKLTEEMDSNHYNLILFSDYNKGMFKGNLARRVIGISKSKKILTLVDPKPENINYFFGCDILRPNKREAEEIAGIKHNGNNLRDIALKLTEKVHPKYLAITCGGDGAFAYDIERDHSELVSTKRVKLADVTGAGDTFAAALGLGMVSGLDFKSSVRLANIASAIVVGKVGTSVTTATELKETIMGE